MTRLRDRALGNMTLERPTVVKASSLWVVAFPNGQLRILNTHAAAIKVATQTVRKIGGTS